MTPRQSHLRTRGWLSSFLNLIQRLNQQRKRPVQLLRRGIQRRSEPEPLRAAEEPEQHQSPPPRSRNQGRNPVRTIEIDPEKVAHAPHLNH